ncbi:polysaccharide biosynthesis C-terminal domain-containing protein [Anabaena lutea]|uniref:Oligosaccharide flippase family protein n=1 Tax=Anabaena lutea FACHB-196 TaxID=2692881 RepID=A0ABR8FBB5_9NOST|nr:polysaccharide biosynthesis C-terminal domain-containing protein [Anabaena lutea]MBD2567391.1 oligosaccharide flippase family protein [Anabaena lutea FACHB-196]
MAKYQLAKNTVSLLVTRLVQSITTFLITAAISRTLGAYVLGQYILAFSYYFIFVSIASQGLKTLFTRELSRNPEEISVYLVSGTFLQLVLSGISYLVLVVVVFILPYNSDTSTVCYIMGLAIIPFALSNITEAVFQAEERMDLIAISTAPIYILRLLVMLWCMQLNYGVNYLAGIFVISETLICLIEWIFTTRIVTLKWQINKDYIWRLFKSARTFLAIDAVGMIASKMEILIISLLGNELLVGLCGAIAQLQQPFMMIVNSLSLAIFPRITKAVDKTQESQLHVTENIIEILMGMSLPFVIGIFFVGGDLLKFIYQDTNFSDATLALQVSSLTLIVYPFVRILNYVLLANGLEKINLIETIATTVIGGMSGVILISQYKLMGAAVMEVVASTTAFLILLYTVHTRLFYLRLWKIMFRPILMSIAISIVFIILKKWHLNLVLNITIAMFFYGLFGIGFLIHELGGITATWKQLFNQNSR